MRKKLELIIHPTLNLLLHYLAKCKSAAVQLHIHTSGNNLANLLNVRRQKCCRPGCSTLACRPTVGIKRAVTLYVLLPSSFKAFAFGPKSMVTGGTYGNDQPINPKIA